MSDDPRRRRRAAPSANAVSARLRRWWIGEAARAPELQRSDLAEAWTDTALQRLDASLVMLTPYDFGEGDPLSGGLRDYLTRRVRELSGETVREVVWRYDDDRRPVRRSRSTSLDVYAPGDPLLPEYAGIAGRLRERIPRDITPEAVGALARLRLVGASRHRLWFAAPSEPARAAIGATPGAAYALHRAVERLQGADPLYTLVADSSPGPGAVRLVTVRSW